MIFRRNYSSIRRSPRQWFNTGVQVFTSAVHMHALGVNISDGGMCLFAVTNMPVGKQVEVEFCPPGSDEPVRMSGTIKHRALYLYGIEFLSEPLPAARQTGSVSELFS